jgi:hypothetical protein
MALTLPFQRNPLSRLRIICVEGGIAIRLYSIVGAEGVCSLPTIDVLEYMAVLGSCFFTVMFLLRM